MASFGFTRDLKNPQSFAYIDLDRTDYGTRLTVTRPVRFGSFRPRLSLGLDLQRQRDARRNFGNNAGMADTTVRTVDQLERVTEVGPFLQSAIDVSRDLTLTAGIRYDRVSFSVADHLVDSAKAQTNQIYLDDSGRRAMGRTSWSLGLNESPSDAITTYASIGTSFETPTTTELANRPDTAGGFNRDLEPQSATSYELGLRARLGGGASLSLALFQADVTHELIGYGIAGSRRRFFRNAGSARHRGIEVGAHIPLGSVLDLVAAYAFAAYRYASYRFVSVNAAVSPPDTVVHVLDGRALPGVPDHWLHVIVSVRPGSWHGLWGEIEETYSGGYFVNDTSSLRAGPWGTTDLRIGWEVAARGVTRFRPFLGFDNLFDRRYVGSVVINDAGGRYFEPAPGRNVDLGVTVGAGR